MSAEPITGKVSDWITEQEIETWQPGDIKLICSGTGTGKSYFVKNTVCSHFERSGKRILYLSPRTLIRDSFQREMGHKTTVQFMTYQAVEEIQNDPQKSMGQWDVIICDEAHFFLSDSSFNWRTDLSFEWIMAQTRAIRIFLTATDSGISRYFQEQKIAFEKFIVPIKQDQIKNLTFFWSAENLEILARQTIAENKKAIFFLQSANAAYTLHQKFPDQSLFLCSRYNSNKTYKSALDNEKISKMIERERFDCNLLFTTTALDTGITIKDNNLTTIITDMTNPTAIVQCIGRKRFVDEADTVDLYVRSRTQQQIGGMLKKSKENASIAQSFMEQGAEEFNARNDRGNDRTGIVVDTPISDKDGVLFQKQINPLRYYHIMYQIEMYQDILQRKDGYIGYIAELLGFAKYNMLENIQKEQSLAQYLAEVADKPLLTIPEREPLIQKLNIRQNRRLCRSYRVLAAWLEGSGLPFRLLEYQTSRIVSEKKKKYRAWKIIKLE